jgi:hypothetical protein
MKENFPSTENVSSEGGYKEYDDGGGGTCRVVVRPRIYNINKSYKKLTKI